MEHLLESKDKNNSFKTSRIDQWHRLQRNLIKSSEEENEGIENQYPPQSKQNNNIDVTSG